MTTPDANQTDRETAEEASDESADGELVAAEQTNPAKPRGIGARMGTRLVEFYQNAISPMFPPSCRFQPTCSEYTRIAIARHGLLRGTYLGVRRLLKCHPFHPGGHDPVPDKDEC